MLFILLISLLHYLISFSMHTHYHGHGDAGSRASGSRRHALRAVPAARLHHAAVRLSEQGLHRRRRAPDVRGPRGGQRRPPQQHHHAHAGHGPAGRPPLPRQGGIGPTQPDAPTVPGAGRAAVDVLDSDPPPGGGEGEL
jgi:hypothetical protein